MALLDDVEQPDAVGAGAGPGKYTREMSKDPALRRAMMPCGECNGSGKTHEVIDDSVVRYSAAATACPQCRGGGTVAVAVPATERAVVLNDREIHDIMIGPEIQEFARPVEPRLFESSHDGLCWRGKCYGDRVSKTAWDDLTADCPFGLVGDRIWVRETFMTLGYGTNFGVEVHYAADGHDPKVWWTREKHRRVIDPCPDRDDMWRPTEFGLWRPAMTMPRWASRIEIEITEVALSVDREWIVSFEIVNIAHRT